MSSYKVSRDLMTLALEMIPVEDKKDYLEALRLAPLLVQTESNPVKFLRVEDFNPWKSARRLVLYWEYRKKYFKKSRWLLSLNDSGAGALDEEDIRLLRSGWLTYVAPNDPTKGRFVTVNHGRYPRQEMEARIRVCFYLCSAASDIPVQSEPGLMGIRLIPTAEPGGLEPEFSNPRFTAAKAIFTMMKEALPIRFRGVMLLKLEEDTMSRIVNQGFDQLSLFFSTLLNTRKPFVVPVSKVSEAAGKLLPLGVPLEVLPVSHGGTFTYEKMFEWKIITKEPDNAANCVKIPWIGDINPPEDKAKEVNALVSSVYARDEERALLCVCVIIFSGAATHTILQLL